MRAQIGDTNNIGISAVTGGSRVTFASGIVVNEATDQVIKSLKSRAAKIWGIDEDAVEWRDGAAHPAGSNAGEFDPLSLPDLAALRPNRRAARSQPRSPKTPPVTWASSAHIWSMWRSIRKPAM